MTEIYQLMTLETYDVNKENAEDSPERDFREETITLSPSQAGMTRKPLKEDLNVTSQGLGVDRPDRFDVSFPSLELPGLFQF